MSFFFGKKKQHSKLGEGWSEHRDPYKDGVVFVLKYLGSHLVDELQPGESYTSGKSTEVIRTIKNFRIRSNKKEEGEKVEIVVKSTGITVYNQETKQQMINSPIERISFCTADGIYPKVFAYIARNTTNETMECFAFSCPSTRIANEVSQGVNQAFQLARDELMARVQSEKSNSSNSSRSPDTNIPKSDAIQLSPLNDQSSPAQTDWVSFD